MSKVTLETLRADYEAALEVRANQLNEKYAAALRARGVEDHASTATNNHGAGYESNALIVAARRLLAAEKREAIIELATRHHIPTWDQYACEMRDMLLKLADGADPRKGGAA
ncbi:hypothetical protein [Sphingomonas sp. R1]|uniref:hypothetical protein n=1 Tax=Sphingomonas sp. R1 TaxID=399176 RepID=UPI00222477BF|nr:hypothetical protein [Sphingomonas sp. R1]UYY77483.1 hypothetical protein OIM94_00270 [Sphingomonas sp. R1]